MLYVFQIITSNMTSLEKDILPGHDWVLHCSVVFDGPEHSFPPWACDIFSDLMFVRVPPPHSLEQSPICQSPHSQSTKYEKNDKSCNFHFSSV